MIEILKQMRVGKKVVENGVEGTDRGMHRGRAGFAGCPRAGSAASQADAPPQEGGDDQVRVQWVTPDRNVLEQTVPDVEQLVFLLRLTGLVSLEGESYRVLGTELLVGEELAVKVRLAEADGMPDEGPD